VDAVAKEYWEAVVRHIVALRGDPAAGVGERYEPTPGGYTNSADLTAGLKAIAPFEISVAGYPEMHPESGNEQADLDFLKAKVDAGADRIITQFVFDQDYYLRYLEKVRAAGIWVPVTPGIIPIHNFPQVSNFARKTGASIPSWLSRRFDGLESDPGSTHLVAAAMATEQVMLLADNGVKQFHFYTLNRADLVYAICHMLGLRPTVLPQQRSADAA
jgi:methylenetetrahydrofolate reductase (NADPH)